MRGRKIGYREITIDQIELIEKLTIDNYSRSKIAELVNCSKNTVWRYQKKLGLI